MDKCTNPKRDQFKIQTNCRQSLYIYIGFFKIGADHYWGWVHFSPVMQTICPVIFFVNPHRS